MTPGEFKKAGEGLEVHWDLVETPFGMALFASCVRGLVKISFCQSGGEAEAELNNFLPRASFTRDPSAIELIAKEVCIRMQGKRPQSTLGILLSGSPFRLKVWRALMEVPNGALVSYGQLAEFAGQSTAVRAVASSVAQNNLAYLIPCHRVIRESGEIGQYRWTAERKKLMITREAITG
jgi:AraC family transcriptional regulator of adaptative response/methylated-DNA-[protein]-cysteine methyltransferase